MESKMVDMMGAMLVPWRAASWAVRLASTVAVQKDARMVVQLVGPLDCEKAGWWAG